MKQDLLLWPAEKEKKKRLAVDPNLVEKELRILVALLLLFLASDSVDLTVFFLSHSAENEVGFI